MASARVTLQDVQTLVNQTDLNNERRHVDIKEAVSTGFRQTNTRLDIHERRLTHLEAHRPLITVGNVVTTTKWLTMTAVGAFVVAYVGGYLGS